MGLKGLRIALVALGLTMAGPLAAQSAASASAAARGITVVINTDVYTMDTRRPWAESFAYAADGRILAVGDEQEILDEFPNASWIVDAQGHMTLPGFQDTHVHVPEAGINEGLCILPAESSLEEYALMIAGCADEQVGDDWVRAAGVSLFTLRQNEELSLASLDRAVPDRPVLILDDIGHAVWTNSRGLAAAGISSASENPQGGVLHRHARTGKLTGLLFEDAQQLVRNAAAQSVNDSYKGLLQAQLELARHGVTSISDAGGYWLQSHTDAWLHAAEQGTLTVRAVNSLYLYPAMDRGKQLQAFQSRFRNEPGELLQFDTAKIYIDGILDLGTAALVEPYDEPIDAAHPSGFKYFQLDQLQAYVNDLHGMGFRMEFHVIGDAATRTALDVVQNIPVSPAEIADRRHRTTHTYLVHVADVPRFASLGIIADFQVGADSVDPDYHEYLAQFIGDRAFDLLPVATIHGTGARVTLSTDWDADPLPPLGVVQRALLRETEGIDDLHTALSMVTLNAAFALGHDDITGSIEVGKQADFVVLDQPLFDLEFDQIDSTQVLLTVVAGNTVFQDPAVKIQPRY